MPLVRVRARLGVRLGVRVRVRLGVRVMVRLGVGVRDRMDPRPWVRRACAPRETSGRR